jgi:predicted nucleotidyltransferase
VDFGLMVQNWGHFNNLVARLCMNTKFRRDTKLNQRLHFMNDRHIDLIPFGGVESSDRMVHWPPEGDFEMNAAGFREAYEAAEQISVNDALPVRVVSAVGLVLLNLMAWRDRHDTHPLRDAADIAYVLRHYKTLLTGKTLLDPHVDLMETEGFELDLASAHHLGRELKRIASVYTRDRILGLLDRELAMGPDSLLVREIAEFSIPVEAQRVCDLLNRMRAGMKD